MAENKPSESAAPAMPAAGTMTQPAQPGQDALQQEPHVLVTADVVGPWPRGSLVPRRVWDKEPASLDRLYRTGALEDPVTDPRTGEVVGIPRRSLAEAVRSESPPTLPYAPNSAASYGELRHAASTADTYVHGALPGAPAAATVLQAPTPLTTHPQLVAAAEAPAPPAPAAPTEQPPPGSTPGAPAPAPNAPAKPS